MEYKRPSITADIIAIKNNQLLLIKRKNDPFKDCYAFPGGFLDVEKKELIQAAAKREFEEETNISVELEKFKYFEFYDDPVRDSRERVITFVYYLIDNFDVDTMKAKDDAKEIKLFSLDEIPQLAFDHKKILDEFLAKHYSWKRY